MGHFNMKYQYYLAVFLLLAGISFLYDYHNTTFDKPAGNHLWRQAQSASIPFNYSREGLDITKPRQLNHYQAKGYGVGEFPVFYYISGILYAIFGESEGWLRGLHLLLFFGGLLSIVKISYNFINDVFLAVCLSLMFFGAPLLVYYGNNFLPDVAALSLILMGWGFLSEYLFDKNKLHLYPAFALFLLGGLLKPLMLISVLAMGGIFILECLGWYRSEKLEREIEHPGLFGILFFSMLLLMSGWVLLAKGYNESIGSTYFLSDTAAIWERQNMNMVTYTIFRSVFLWSEQYFFTFTNWLILFLIPVVLLGRKFPGSLLYSLTLFSFMGCILFYTYWFYQFTSHDYYVAGFYPFFLFLFLSGLTILKKYYNNIFKSYVFRFLIVGLIISNIIHSKEQIRERYRGHMAEKVNAHLYEEELQSYLSDLNIKNDDLIVSMPDRTPCFSLYLLQRAGYSEWVGNFGAKIKKEHLDEFMNSGAEYLILNDTSAGFKSKPHVQPFLDKPIGRYKSIQIYDLSIYNTPTIPESPQDSTRL